MTLESLPQQPPQLPKDIPDLKDYTKTVDFKVNDSAQTLKDLAQKDETLAENFQQAIVESLIRQGYPESQFSNFWNIMHSDGCTKVKVENGLIKFLKIENGQEKEIAPKLTVIPIRIDITKFNPCIPHGEYYDSTKQKVSLKKGHETETVTVDQIVKFEREGTQITVIKPTEETARTATFKPNQEGKLKAYYDDKQNEIVKIYDGYIVKIARPEVTKSSATKSTETNESFGKYLSAGKYKYVDPPRKDVFTAEDYINAALQIAQVPPKTLPTLTENPNLKKLRENYPESDQQRVEKYTAFLTKHNAITAESINLLVDTREAEAKTKFDQDSRKRETDKTARTTEFTKTRNKYLNPDQIGSLLNKLKFVITDPKLLEAVKTPEKWRIAWNDDSIEGLKALKGIITSEPELFGDYAKTESLIRDRIRAAIYNSNASQIDFEDLIDNILQVRMPSFAEKSTPEAISKLTNGGAKFTTIETIKKTNLDEVRKADGFLKKLGTESYESAYVRQHDESNHAVWLNFVFEGKGYTVKVNPDGAISGNTINIFYLNTETPYAKGSGYDNSYGYTISTLTTGSFEANNKVQADFRDAVTPPMTYSRLVDVYKANFNLDGTPKTNIPAAFQEKMNNIIIGGNRFLLQLRDMQLTEKSTGDLGRYNFAENRRGEVTDQAFLDIVGNDKKWAAEWAKPTRETTMLLKKAFEDDAVLRLSARAAIDDTTLGKRVQTAVTDLKNEYLYIDDVIDHILAGSMSMPSHAPEARDLSKDLGIGAKFTEYYLSQDIKTDSDQWAMLVLKALSGQGTTGEALDRAVVKFQDKNKTVITTTFDNHIYTLEFKKGGGLTHMIKIQTPDGQAYPDSHGYDNSEEFVGNMTDTDAPKILNWFREAVTPTLTSSSKFRAEYARIFDAQGNPKPGVSPEIADHFQAIMRASNRLVMAFEGKSIQDSQAREAKENSEGTYASQLLRNAKLETKSYGCTGVFNADDIYNNYKSDQLYFTRTTTSIDKSVGLQIQDSILGDPLSLKIQNDVNKLKLFRAIFQVYTLPELISQGCIKKGNTTVPQNQPFPEFYVIDSLPTPGLGTWLQEKTPPTDPTNFEKLIANHLDLSIPEYRDRLNPNAHLSRIASFFFPERNSSGKYEDVEAKVNIVESEKNFDYNFAHTQFLKEISEKEGISSDKMLAKLKEYLELFTRKFDERHPDINDKARQQKKLFNDKFQNPNNSLATIETLETLMKSPDKDIFIWAIRDGFLRAHETKIDTQHTDAIENMKNSFKEWKQILETSGEMKELEKALRAQGIPESEIPLVVEKLLPVWFGLGVDTSNGTFGVAAGYVHQIKLGKNAEYGIITIGGGAGVGRSLNGIAVGPAAAAVYKTPHFGPFSLFGGGGVGLGIDSSGLSLGGAVGGGISIEWGTVGATKISSDIGVAYVPGMPFPLPGVTVHFEKNHEASEARLIAEARKGYELDVTDKALKSATTDKARVEAIAKNILFCQAYAKSYGSPVEYSPEAHVIAKYKQFEDSLTETVRSNYNPALFLNITKLTVGFGIDPESGKFIFLVGGTLITGQEAKVVALEGKKAAVMDQEIQLSQMRELSRRYNAGEISQDSPDHAEVVELIRAGKLLVIPGSKDVAIYMPKGNIPATAETPAPDRQNPQSKNIEKRFNSILTPLNLQVVFDESKKLFELKFLDWNNHTNYDIAVDSQMSKGGIIVDGGHIYLAKDFTDKSTLAILRSDYEYTHEKEGKLYHSIITISDSPLTPAHDIYNSAQQILSSKGGNWLPQQGSGFDKAAKPQPRKFFTNLGGSRQYQFDEAKFNEYIRGAKATVDNQETQSYINALTITPEEKGKADENTCATFADKFLKAHEHDYRIKSNRESKTSDFGDLNKLIITDWKTSHNNKEPNTAELILIRLKIMDASFIELGPKELQGADRQKAFEARLNETEEKILKPRFRQLIADNHSKFAKGNPNFIQHTAEELSRVILNRVRGINVNETGKGTTLLKNIDRTSTVAGTMGILGLRGNVYGADTGEKEKMLGSSENYFEALKTDPSGYAADIARLIFEETSKMPQGKNFTDKTTTIELTNSAPEIHDLLRADFSQQIISTLFVPESRDIFSIPELRTEILRLASQKDKLTFDAKYPSAQALKEFQALLHAIRNAEMTGEKEYIPTSAPNLRFVLNPEVRDGVYEKCTNYSMWIKEDIRLELRSAQAAPDIAAAYGLSTAITVPSTHQEIGTISAAAAVAVKPPETPPEITTPETPKAGTGSSTDVDTSVKGSPGAKALPKGKTIDSTN